VIAAFADLEIANVRQVTRVKANAGMKQLLGFTQEASGSQLGN
jgi:hypothetical protein